jgi:hypothetical protein
VAHYVDLHPCDYVRFNLARRHLALAIGWLDPHFDYPRGDVPGPFLDRLAEITSNPGDQGFMYFGRHFCALSAECRDYSSSHPDLRFPVSSGRELFVPFHGCLFVSPENVGHYIVAHGYAPPPQFIEAVECCPPIGSESYYEQTWRFFRLTTRDLGPVPETVPWLSTT